MLGWKVMSKAVCSGEAETTVIEGYNGNALAHQGYDDKHVPL